MPLNGELLRKPQESKPMSDIPRRSRMDLWTPAETAIRNALIAVEAVGADERLTEAVVLLGHAQERVADYVDGIHSPNCTCYSCKGRCGIWDHDASGPCKLTRDHVGLHQFT